MAETQIQQQLRLLTTRLTTEYETLAMMLADGEISLKAWRITMENSLRDNHLAAAVIGNGVNNRLPDNTADMARQQANNDIAYLGRWYDELRKSPITPDQSGRIVARARLYALSVQETGERAIDIFNGIPELPFYPTDRTICLRNCKCRWDRRKLDGRGNFDCYWRLGNAEHCTTCQARARIARPLQVRRGQILNPERYQSPVLYRD